MARLGAALVRAGVPLRWKAGQSLQAAVTQGLSLWLTSQWGTLRNFDIRCRLAQGVEAVLGEYIDAWTDAEGAGPAARAIRQDFLVGLNEDHVALVFAVGDSTEVLVGYGVEALEAIVPGLGWDALALIESVGQRFDTVGLGWLEHTASMMYWGGYDNEAELCRAIKADLSQFTGLMRAELEAALPVERLRQTTALPDAVLTQAAGSDNAIVSRVAGLLQRARKLGKADAPFPDHRYQRYAEWDEPVDALVLLGWHDFEMTRQIHDDFRNNSYLGGCDPRPYLGMVCVSLRDPHALHALEKRWSAALEYLQIADALLTELRSAAPA